MRRLALVILLSAAVALELELLERDHHHPPVSATDTARAGEAPAERGLTLLDVWTQELVPSILLQRARADALRTHDLHRAANLERRLRPSLLRVLGFGPAAAHEMQQVRATGAAWTAWAAAALRRTARPRGIARLEAHAIRLHQAAYEAVDATIRAAYRGRRRGQT